MIYCESLPQKKFTSERTPYEIAHDPFSFDCKFAEVNDTKVYCYKSNEECHVYNLVKVFENLKIELPEDCVRPINGIVTRELLSES